MAQSANPPLPPRTMMAIYLSVGLGYLVMITIQVIFFWLISKAIGISKDEADLVQSPPKIPLAQWNAEELQPAKQRQMLIDIGVLTATLPLVLFLLILTIGLVQESMRVEMIFSMAMNRDISVLILLEVALIVLTVLWCSYHPTKRMTGFALLFLVSSWLVLGYLEFSPFVGIVMTYFMASDFWGMSSNAFGKGYFLWHLTAAAFLVYSLFASVFCWLNR
jgi:membrane-associated HD superfamily phosphohydrolase